MDVLTFQHEIHLRIAFDRDGGGMVIMNFVVPAMVNSTATKPRPVDRMIVYASVK